MLQEVLRTLFKKPEILCVGPSSAFEHATPSALTLSLWSRRPGTSGNVKSSTAVSTWRYPAQIWGLDFSGLLKVAQLAHSSGVSHVAFCLLGGALPIERCVRLESARHAISDGDQFVACGPLALESNAHHPISDLCLAKTDMLVLLRFLAYARRTETLQKGEAAVLFESTEFIPYPLHNAIYPAPFFTSRMREVESMVRSMREQEPAIVDRAVSSPAFSHCVAAYFSYAFSTTTRDAQNVRLL